jgi:penicillin-binding protein 2
VQSITDSDGNVVEQLEPDPIRQIPVSPENLAVVREGMFGAVNWSQGTAPGARVAGIAVAGKTGTAEFWDPEIGYDAKGRLPTHAWFTAFAPYDNPEIAIAVFIYNGGEGSAVAVPVTSEILHYYFDVPMPPGDPYLRLRPGDLPSTATDHGCVCRGKH